MTLKWLVLVAATGCADTPSTFDFTTTGDVSEHVASSLEVTGEIDNAGQLALDDGVWILSMTMNGLASTQDETVLELTLIDKPAGVRFSTSIGGTCGAQLAPHGSTNGDVVHGVFHCTGLGSSDGKHVDIGFGEFATAINDAANDPNLNPPYP
jgi:hypothetical protein